MRENMTKKETENIPLDKRSKIANGSLKKSRKKIGLFAGLTFGIVSELCLAISNIFIKKAEFFSDMEQAFIRYSLQLVSMFLVIQFYKLKIVQDDKKTGLKLIARGILGTLSILCTMRSLKLINPSDTIALVNLNVIFVALLAKILLPNEKLSVFHYLALPITFSGVLFLVKPTFLFDQFKSSDNLTESSSDSSKISTSDTFMGIAFGLLSAFFWSLTIILIRKLNIAKVHYSIATIYTSFVALPITFLISLLNILMSETKRDESIVNSKKLLINQIIFMLIGATSGIFQIVFYYVALKYQHPTKIALIQPMDLVFGFILQFFILRITVDLFECIGTGLILFGVMLVILINYIKTKK